MTAPTAKEIREAIEARLDRQTSGTDNQETAQGMLHQVITQNAADPFIDSASDTLEIDGGGVWEALRAPHRHAVWTNLRPSEAARLVELTEAACDRAEARCVAVILEELTAAGVEFAAEYPDAPRAEREAVAA